MHDGYEYEFNKPTTCLTNVNTLDLVTILPLVCFYTFDFYYSFEEFPRNLRTCRITLIRMVYFLIESYNRKDIM